MPKLLTRGQPSARVRHFCIVTIHLVSYYTLRLLLERVSYIVAAHFFIAMHFISVLASASRYELNLVVLTSRHHCTTSSYTCLNYIAIILVMLF